VSRPNCHERLVHDVRSYAASNLRALDYDQLNVSSLLGQARIETPSIHLNVKRDAHGKALKGFTETIKAVDEQVNDSEDIPA